MTRATARLVLVGTPIGNLADLAPRAIDTLAAADVIACEDTRRTGRLLAHVGVKGPRLMAVHEHNERGRADEIVELVRAGQTVALVTDAGMPGISDPGQKVVEAVVAAGLAVQTVPGPTALVAALVSSGLSPERFVFDGFLPRKGKERKQRLAALADERRTIVLYEAPHRLAVTLADLVDALGPSRRVALARELTKLYEEIWRGTLTEAVHHVDETDPRGEYVLVIEGAPDAPPPTDEVVAAALVGRWGEGMGAKQAAAAVADELGIPQRRAYEIGLGTQT